MLSIDDNIAALIANAEKDATGLPPVHQWNPPLSGTMDMQIRADGRWFYLGSEIKRPKMVKLFSTILRRDEDTYFLVTPVEKWIIQVDDAPFVATTVERVNDATSDGVEKLIFTTNVGATVVAGKAHPIRVEVDASGQPRPYLRVRDNLDALIHRNAFYQLVEWAHNTEADTAAIQSDGETFVLGSFSA